MPQQNGVLVVTGGSRGIGAATALLGAERGYAVVVNYASNVDAAERVCARIHQQGGEAVAVRGDVANPTISSISSRQPIGSARSPASSTMPA